MNRNYWKYFLSLALLVILFGIMNVNNVSFKDHISIAQPSDTDDVPLNNNPEIRYDTSLNIPHSDQGLGCKVEGIGTYFELVNSSYLDVTLTSSEVVKVIFESVPRMIGLHIEKIYDVHSTSLTIGGFEPNTIYYHYQDGKLVRDFQSTIYGDYSFEQNIFSPHHLYIMEEKSTVYINANGTISGTTNITRNGDSYTLVGDVNQSLVIERNNMTINGLGYRIQGNNTGYGIYLNQLVNVHIINVHVYNFTTGILFNRQKNSSVIGNTFDNYIEMGIYSLIGFENNLIEGNTFISGNNGGVVIGSDQNYNNTIRDNQFLNTGNGIITSNLKESSIINNTLTRITLGGGGIQIRESEYILCYNNKIINYSYGIVCFAGSASYTPWPHFINITENDISGSTWGITLASSSNTTVQKNNISNCNTNGIWIYQTKVGSVGNSHRNLNISQNKIFDNNIGIVIYYLSLSDVYCNNSRIFLNELDNNGQGIRIAGITVVNDSFINYIYDNEITNSLNWGLYLRGSNTEVYGNHIINTTSPTGRGIYVDSGRNFSITNNLVENSNEYGLYITSSSGNLTFYMNSFVHNNYGSGSQAFDDGTNNNISYNFWDDWTSPDTNNDSIIDDPYLFDGTSSNEDPYPLAGSSILDDDKDGLTDFEELLLGTDPQNPDSDGDTLTDSVEVLIYFTNPLMNDTDLDGLDDFEEVTIGLDGFYTNPLLNDTDGDLLDDFEEVNLGLDGFLTDPTSDDTDLDGLLDGEEYDYSSNPLVQDSDSDDLLDGEEVHSYGTSPTNNDTESDGLPDGYEVANGLSPLLDDSSEDPDADNLTNLEEFNLGTDPQNADTDGDSYNDGEEIAAGTDPLDPNDFPQIPAEVPFFPPITEDPTAAIIITAVAIVSASIVSGLMIQSIIGKGVDLLTDNLGKVVLANQELLGSIKDQVSGLVEKINKELVEVKDCPKCGTKVVSAYCHLCGTTTDFEKARLLKERILED